MNEEEVIKSMKEGLEDVDRFLNRIARHSSILLKPEKKWVSKADLDSFAESFRAEINVEGIRDSITTILQDYNDHGSPGEEVKNTIEIPLTSLSHDKNQVVLQLKPSDVIENTLVCYDVVISIHRLDETCTEIPHVDTGYLKKDDVVTSDEEGVIDSKDLLVLKSKNREKWERVISNMEFQYLMQQMYQIISSLDLQLSIGDIDKLAKQAICIIVTWKESCDVDSMSNGVLGAFFGKHDRGIYVFKAQEGESALSNVRCKIGARQWGDHHSIGMKLEMDMK